MTQRHCDIELVEKIPGDLEGVHTIDLNVRSYAGYTHDNDHYNNMFGCFFEAQPCMGDDDAARFPLMLWFNGGPGASSMFGAMSENGPYLIRYTGRLVENPYSWNREAHIMYWDNPVGAGYSYNGEGVYVTNEEEVGEAIYQALQIFFQDERYRKYRKCPLYVTGESYGGKYIPGVCNVLRQKKYGTDPDSGVKEPDPDDVEINLKGMAIGNPWMDPLLQTRKRLQLGLDLGFLDTKQHKLLSRNADRMEVLLKRGEYHKAFNFNQGIKKDLIACGGNVAIYDVRAWNVDLIGPMVEKYFRLKRVKKALHAPEAQPWGCADETGPVTFHLIKDYMTPSSQKSLQPFLDQRDDDGDPAYRTLIFTGNLDMSCGIAGTEEMLQNLEWRCASEWKKLNREVWASPRSRTKGFVKSFANLTQMVIPCSGHMVPSFQPEVSLDMINTFIKQRKFPTYRTPIPKEYPDEIEG